MKPGDEARTIRNDSAKESTLTSEWTMLTEEEKQEIEEELSHYPTKRAGGVEALKIVQRRRGWISDDTLRAVASIVGMPPAELDRLATFYNLIFRKPVGRHVLLVCDSISCWLMGSERVRTRLRERLDVDLGGTTKDGNCTLLPIVCLGACDRAPTLMIDETLYGPLTEDEVDRILDAHKVQDEGHGQDA